MDEIKTLQLHTVVVTLTDHEAVGAEAREIRKKYGITMDDICVRLKVSRSFYCRTEKGDRAWTEPMIDRFNKAVKEILDERSKVPDA